MCFRVIIGRALRLSCVVSVFLSSRRGLCVMRDGRHLEIL